MYIPENWGSRLASPYFRPNTGSIRRNDIKSYNQELAKIEQACYDKQEASWKAWKLRWS